MTVSFDPEVRAELVRRAKKQIRVRMRALRGGHTPASLRDRSKRIVERILELPEVQAARGVALFWPMESRGEVDLRALDAELRGRGARLFYPFMDPLEGGGYRTGFRETRDASELMDRGQRFFEPPREARTASPGDVDLVFVPALAADARGHRVGYGAGYYDATLADVCPPAKSVIVTYDFQVLAELPTEVHDVACSVVVTDQRTYYAT